MSNVYVVESLVQQCQFYILMHLEEFPVDYLSLLPLYSRKQLLWQMPIADVCQLMDTRFTKGLETEVTEFIYSHFRYEDYYGIIDCGDKDVKHYIENRWDDDMAYAREILYGQLVTGLLNCLQQRGLVQLVQTVYGDNGEMHS